jgi:hypothetical protein
VPTVSEGRLLSVLQWHNKVTTAVCQHDQLQPTLLAVRQQPLHGSLQGGEGIKHIYSNSVLKKGKLVRCRADSSLHGGG